MAQATPGWYHAQGDPDGTVRWWDGATWVGGPVAPAGAPASTTPGPASTALGGTAATTLGVTDLAGTATTTAAAGSTVPEVHGRPLGDITRRVFGHIVDSIVITLFSVPAIVAMLRSIDWDAIFEGRTTELDFTMPVGLMAVAWVLSLLYLVVPIALWGATLGKRVLGLEVIRASDGASPPGFTCALLRGLPTFLASGVSLLLAANANTVRIGSNVGTLLAIVSLVLAVRDDRRRSVSDRVGRTYVVARRR